MFRIAALILILSASACGMKRPLVLPPGPPPEPLFGNPKAAPAATNPSAPPTAKQPAQNGPDVSTDAPAQKP